MTAPVHPLLEQAQRDRELEALNQRLANLELEAEGRPGLRKTIDRIRDIDARFMQGTTR